MSPFPPPFFPVIHYFPVFPPFPLRRRGVPRRGITRLAACRLRCRVRSPLLVPLPGLGIPTLPPSEPVGQFPYGLHAHDRGDPFGGWPSGHGYQLSPLFPPYSGCL